MTNPRDYSVWESGEAPMSEILRTTRVAHVLPDDAVAALREAVAVDGRAAPGRSRARREALAAAINEVRALYPTFFSQE